MHCPAWRGDVRRCLDVCVLRCDVLTCVSCQLTALSLTPRLHSHSRAERHLQQRNADIDPAPRLLWHRIIITCYWVTVLPSGRCMYTACRSCRSVPSHSTRIPRRSEQNYWRCRWNFAVIFTIFRALSNLAKYFIEELNSVRPSSGQPWLRLMSLSTTIYPGAKV